MMTSMVLYAVFEEEVDLWYYLALLIIASIIECHLVLFITTPIRY
jgi:hypothetical protein